MSEPSVKPKRQRKREKRDTPDDEPLDMGDGTWQEKATTFRRWLDEGTEGPNGIIDHDLLGIRIGEEIVNVSLGDTVLLRSPTKDEETNFEFYGSRPDSPSKANVVIARIEKMWEEPISDALQAKEDDEESGERIKRLKVRARWFLNQQDALSLQGKYVGDVPEDWTDSLTSHDLLLSNQTDDNCVATICGPCYVLYRQPDADKEIPNMPHNAFVCRYSLDFDGEGVRVVPFAGENDDWTLVESLARPTPHKKKDMKSSVKRAKYDKASDDGQDGSDRSAADASETADTDASVVDSVSDEDSEDSASDDDSTDRREIRIGPEHQVQVPKYVPNRNVTNSYRNPTLVWQPGKISQKELDEYLESVSRILTPYLKKNGLTPDQPYSPIPRDFMEAEAQALNGEKPTLSQICTSSSLSSKRNRLLRECNSEALLELLSRKKYNVNSAIAAVEASPRDYLTVWSTDEKDIFSSGFRRYSGSLRMIAKGIAPSKEFKDVVDYYYRFKIPDQFRRLTDMKREQAVRIMECIETRRSINAFIPTQTERVGNDDNGKRQVATGDWAKTSVADVTGAVEHRRVDAKQLLLDLEQELGKEKLAEVATAIKRWHHKSVTQLKVFLVHNLKGHPALLERFVEYLPRRHRS